MLDFRMETFLTVCQCMNYTRASEVLNITQPAVSQHIRFLEKHYGTKLFRLEGKKLVLTPAGEILRSAAAAQKQDELSLQNQILKIEKPVKDIRFGTTAAVGEAFMGKVLQGYFQKDPDVQLSVQIGTTQELLKQLDGGNLDFVLTDGFFEREDYESVVYSTERLVAVSSPEEVLRKKEGNLSALFDKRLLVTQKEDGAREALERFLAVSDCRLADFKKRAEIGSIQTIKNLVKTGCGIAFLYKASVKEELEEGTLKEIKIKNFNVTHDFTFLWRRSSIYGELYRDFFGNIVQL